MAATVLCLTPEEASAVMDLLMREVVKLTTERKPGTDVRCRMLSQLAQVLFKKGVRPEGAG